MIVLYWKFNNGHSWHKLFESIEAAEKAADTMGLFTSLYIESAWIETDETTIYLKEKHYS